MRKYQHWNDKIFFDIKVMIVATFLSIITGNAKLFAFNHLPDNHQHSIINLQDTLKIKISGVVLDAESSQRLAGVTIIIKSTPLSGTSTSENGSFNIEAQSSDTLLISDVGYDTKEVAILGQKNIIILLTRTSGKLSDVVVVAFGKQKKTELVGAETIIQPSELKIPASNLTTALAGRLAGMIAFQRSGEPGKDNASFFIRGITTFGFKTDPLILIDNVEVTSNDLARLQADDIASFAIMKDATATALYGSRAANGVILITTKEGKEGPAKVTLRLENSWSENTKNIKLADPVTYMKLENESVLTRNSIGVLPYTQSKIDNTIAGLNPYLYPANDWMKQLLKPTATTQRASLNVRGGGKIARYYISGSYDLDNGILKVDHRNNYNSDIKLKTYQLRSNINVNLTKTTEVTIRLSGLFDEYAGPIDGGAGTFQKILSSNPVLFPAFYPANLLPYAKHILFGNSSRGVSVGGTSGIAQPNFINPYADMVKGFQNNSTSTMSAQFELKQDLAFFIPGLSARILFNTTRFSNFSVSRFYNPFFYEIGGFDRTKNIYTLSLLNQKTATEFLNYNEGADAINTATYYEAAIDYHRKFGKNEVTGLLVSTRRNQLFANQGTLQKSLPYRNDGVSGRVTYAYDGRYITEVNFGYNGSERFSQSHRFGFFPSVGLAYNISKEKFWDPIRNVISALKIRATYGLVGNDAIGSADDRFFYLSVVNMDNPDRSATFGNNYGYSLNGITINRFSNDNITWETSHKLNLGLDLSILNGIKITADFFTEKRDNILMNRAFIPNTMGLTAPVRANLGKAKGYGTDISVDYNKTFRNNWWLQLHANFTYAHSEYDFFEEPNYPDKEKYLQHKGQAIFQQWGLIAERLFIDDKDVANSPKQNFGEYGAGDIKYRDVNGDGEITNLDRVPIGNPTVPEIIYGTGLSIGYKAFDFSFFFQGSARSSFWIDPSTTAPFVANPNLGAGSQNALLQAYADDYWSEDNRNSYALWPRLSHTPNANDNQLSTWFMQNGAFVRLKSAELGYTLPSKVFGIRNISNSRIYINGLNLLCFSNFKLWDIEMGGNGLGYPIQRVFNAGITIGF